MYRISFIKAALCILMPAWLFAQQPQSHEKKVVVAKENTIFWNADLPVYFFLSTSPDGSNPIKLVKGNADKYTNPYFFDTEGINFVRTKWAVDPVTKEAITPEMEIQFEVERDGTAPLTTLSLDGAKKHVSDGVLFYGKGLSGTLTSEDGLAGVESTFQSVNKAAFTTGSGSIDFSEEGEYLVQYYAVDIVGNAEEPKSKLFTVDITAPVSSHEVSGTHQGEVLSPKAAISLSSTDGGAGLRYIYHNYDGGVSKVYGEKLYVGWMEDGEHSIEYYAEDLVRNKEEKKVYNFYLDKTAPIVRADIEGLRHTAGGKTFIAGASNIVLSAIDNRAGVDEIYYSISGSDYLKYEKPFPIDRKQGAANVKFYATDKVGNKSNATVSKETGEMYLDLTAPKALFSYKGKQFMTRDTMFITNQTEVVLKAIDYESGVEKITYTVDGGAEQTFEESIKIEKEGIHNVDFTVFDNVGNSRKEQFCFIVDNTGPGIFHHLSMDAIGFQNLKDREKPLPVYAAHTLLYLAATDILVGTEKIYYSLDGGAEKLYTGPVKTSKSGLRTLKVRAIDKLGNETESDLIELVIQ